MTTIDAWLRQQLSSGPVELTAICAATTRAGFTLLAAADALRRIGGRLVGTKWALIAPAAPAAAPARTVEILNAAEIYARRRQQGGHSEQPIRKP